MTVTHAITMDLVKPLVRPLVVAVQGEGCSRVLQISLLASGVPFPVPEGAAPVVRYRKRDGTSGIYDTLPDGTLAWSAQDNVLSVTLAPQVLTCDGMVDLQVELRQGEGVLSTFSVGVLVDPDPSRGAQPSEDYFNWMDATRQALEDYLAENPVPGSDALQADNEQALRQALAQGKRVLVTASLPLTGPIVIDRSGSYLEFAEGAVLDLRGKDFPAILVTYQADGSKPSFVTIRNATVQGDGTKGSVGIALEAMSYDCHIEKLSVDGCEYGIQTTGGFDCAQQNTFYEPYICNCRIGIEDSCGGLQNCRIYGGRIESNGEWGMVTASPNLCVEGTMLQGNRLGEVKLVNTEGLGAIRKSGGSFINCYFERIVRYDESGAPIADSIFRLGDEAQNEGWFGDLNLIGCKLHYGDDNYAVQCLGDALPQGVSTKTVQIMGCMCYGKQLLHLPNTGVGCNVQVLGHIPYQDVKLPTEGVHPDAAIQYLTNRYSRLGVVRATQILGNRDDFSPMEYAYTKELRLEPREYGDDGSELNSAGEFRMLTASAMLPWEDPAAGILAGSLHYCTEYHDTDSSGNKVYFKTPGWFVRTYGKGVLENGWQEWGALISGNAYAVADRVHGKSLLLEKDGSDYGDWITATYSHQLPWLHAGAGITKGSLHYCSANGYWYQRIAGNPGTDSEERWGRLIQGDYQGVLRQVPTRELMVLDSNNAAISVTGSQTLPWLDESSGERPGSLHYCGLWYERVHNRDGADSESKWRILGGSGMPQVTAGDHGKLLQVVDGAWQAVAVADSAVKTYVDEYISSALEGDY